MKKILLLLFLFPLVSRAQDASTPQDSTVLLSDYEYFSLQPGKIFKQKDSSIGFIKDIKVFCSISINQEDGSVMKAVTFQQAGAQYNRAIIIDFADIEGVLKSLEYFQSLATAGKQRDDPSYTFLTKHDVRISLSYNGKWSFIIEKVYHYKKASEVANSMVLFEKEQIKGIIFLIKRAIGK